MPIILVATTNPGKLDEYRHLLSELPDTHVLSPNDAEVWIEVAETEPTLAGNALLKAHTLYEALPEEAHAEGWWVLGDDSGLEVDAMDGGPGVHSNRWAGPNTNAADRNRLLLERLENVPDEARTARFRCAIALIEPDGTEHIVEGTVEGRIARELRGSGGFGYDPLFELPDGRRLAELTPDEKNELSHRGVAGKKALEVLKSKTGPGK
ncbi:MAG TPA: RdgB/HAM1 family non-canonical purine NTP pyrophosphatase [Chloroflexia bacterium]|jgi:XTP/dITP diphosphohydrolase